MGSGKKNRPFPRCSLYQKLHGEVMGLLDNAGIPLAFNNVDDDVGCTNSYDTNVMGRFFCHNPSCKSTGWSSNKIAITIRLYPGPKYNARVYHQRCKSCHRLSRPKLDHSYAERIVYRIKKWYGLEVEQPTYSASSSGPHNEELCEGCAAGRCSRIDEALAREMCGLKFGQDEPSSYS